MCRIFVCSLLVWLGFPCMGKSEVVNQPVVNLYVYPEKDTELQTQAIYGSFVEVLQQTNSDWAYVKLSEGTQGWIETAYLTHNPSFEKSDHLRPVKNLFAHIYRVTDTVPYPPLFTLPYRAKVKVEDIVDREERWIRIELVSGEKAWIQKGDIALKPQWKTLAEMLEFSKKFIGLPYTWGGTSSYGFDCSGFVQMLFQEMGVNLPRHSKDQAQSEFLFSLEQRELLPGDLVFFGEEEVTHVGLYLGRYRFIHACSQEDPVIQISTLQKTPYPYLTARRLHPKYLPKKGACGCPCSCKN